MTQVYQTDDHGTGLIIEVTRLRREHIRPEVNRDGIEPRGTGAERHQSIHRRTAVFQGLPGAAVEMPARQNHHRQGDDPDSQPDVVICRGQHHIVADHSPDHHRNTDSQRQCSLPAEPFHIGDSNFLLTLTAFGIILNQLRTVTGFLHGGDQRIRRSVTGDQRTALREVNTGVLHAVHTEQRFVYFADATRTGHAVEQEGETVVVFLYLRHSRGIIRCGRNIAVLRCRRLSLRQRQRFRFWGRGFSRHHSLITGGFHRAD